VGFDVTQSDPTATDFIAVGEGLDDVGAVYPHLTVQYTNETAPGETTYNFIGPDGPGQDRQGQLLVTARAEDRDEGYTGDSTTHNAVDAADLVDELTNEVEACVGRNYAPQATTIGPLGSYSGPDAPDDREASPTVRIAQVIVTYYYARTV
jgi:hypothetical protein